MAWLYEAYMEPVNEGKILDKIKNLFRKNTISAPKEKEQKDEDKPKKYDYNLKRVSSPQEFDKLYKEEALCAEGYKDPDKKEEGDRIYDYVQGFGNSVKPHLEFRWCRGSDLNKNYHLTGDNKYPDNLGIFFIYWVGYMDPDDVQKGQWRWFSDVVDNNARREIQKGNPYYKDYHSLYGDDWFYSTI